MIALCDSGFALVNGGYYDGLELGRTSPQVTEKRSVDLDRLLELSQKLTGPRSHRLTEHRHPAPGAP